MCGRCYYLGNGGLPLGGHVQMDLSYETIPQYDGTPFILYKEPTYLPHVIKPRPYYETCEIEKPSPILPTQDVSSSIQSLKRVKSGSLRKNIKLGI